MTQNYHVMFDVQFDLITMNIYIYIYISFPHAVYLAIVLQSKGAFLIALYNQELANALMVFL